MNTGSLQAAIRDDGSQDEFNWLPQTSLSSTAATVGSRKVRTRALLIDGQPRNSSFPKSFRIRFRCSPSRDSEDEDVHVTVPRVPEECGAL